MQGRTAGKHASGQSEVYEGPFVPWIAQSAYGRKPPPRATAPWGRWASYVVSPLSSSNPLTRSFSARRASSRPFGVLPSDGCPHEACTRRSLPAMVICSFSDTVDNACCSRDSKRGFLSQVYTKFMTLVEGDGTSSSTAPCLTRLSAEGGAKDCYSPVALVSWSRPCPRNAVPWLNPVGSCKW